MIKRKCPLCNSDRYKELKYYVREFKNCGPRVVRCSLCNLIFLNPVMGGVEYKYFYDNDGQKKFVDTAVNEDYFVKLSRQSYRKDLINKYLNKNIRVIDVGCGYSYFLDSIRNQVKSVCGIEPSVTRANIERNGIKIFNGNLEDWPHSNSADLITMFHVLEHIVDLDRFMLHVKRVLCCDGRFVIEVPNHDDILVGLKKYKWFYYQNAHCSYFNTHTVLYLLKKFGFVIEEQIKIQRYSLSNHLHWFIFGRPGYIKRLSFLDKLWSWFIK